MTRSDRVRLASQCPRNWAGGGGRREAYELSPGLGFLYPVCPAGLHMTELTLGAYWVAGARLPEQQRDTLGEMGQS